MEQLLNIAWLLIVACIILATAARPRQSPHHANGRSLVALVVFACVAVLLFPVISATDDLHPGSDLSDDAAWRHGKRSLGMHALVLLVVVSAPLLMVASTAFAFPDVPAAYAGAGYLRRDAGRAPPCHS